jgi:hypothetical protein
MNQTTWEARFMIIKDLRQLYVSVLIKSPKMEFEVGLCFSRSRRTISKKKSPWGKWKAIQKILLCLFRFFVLLIVHWMTSGI